MSKCHGQTSIMASEVEVKQASPSTPQSVSQPETPVEGNGNNGGFVFNEQTNYVPKRTIITVPTYTPWLVSGEKLTMYPPNRSSSPAQQSTSSH